MKVQEALTKTLAYYSQIPSEGALKALSSNINGLTQKEVLTRIALYGRNAIRETKKAHALIQLVINFKNPLVIILISISIISFVVGETLDGIIVAIMVLMSVILNFVQEYKASKAADKLKDHIATLTTVVRDGQKTEVNAKLICIGDIIQFNAGDIIPADCRIIRSKDLYANQSSLTGESFPVEKHETAVDNPTDVTTMTNILFHGTSVLTGSATAIVVKIGDHTQFGKIAINLSATETENEFTQGINTFSVFILKVIIIFVLFILLVNSFLKQDFLQSLFFSIAVAVGLTPEFLPMIMSVTMAKGSLNMAKKGVIVKRLSAIPTFGSMDILCTDKTGTLTEDKIELVRYVDIEGQHSDFVLFAAYLNSTFQTGITNPMDSAILDYKKLDISDYIKLDEIPFDFERKRMSVVVKNKKEILIISKGAPEQILAECRFYRKGNASHETHVNAAEDLTDQYTKLSKAGFRVLAVAAKKLSSEKKTYTESDEKDMELLGYTAFLDPAKKSAKQAIEELEKMEVEVKIITGDSELVAKKICTEVGLNIKGIMLGQELAATNDELLKTKLNDVTIFARCTPDDKNTIIRLLREMGHVVGYMGDGINDAPSLKNADVGISVDNAVDVAKESADIILTKKSLHQLKSGVIEGRKTFGNTMKYIMMGISSNFGNMFSVLGAVIFLPFLPMLPIQIILNNFLYDLSQITIPTDNVDEEFIKKPKRWNMKYIKNFMLVFGPISSAFDYLTFFVVFFVFKISAAGFQTSWFIVSLATQTLVIHIIRTSKIPFIQSAPSKPLLISTIAVLVVGGTIPFTKLGSLFGFIPLSPLVLISMGIIVIGYMATVQTAKRYFYKKYL